MSRTAQRRAWIRATGLVVLLATVGVGAACFKLVASGDHLAFSHEKHVAGLGLPCETCHDRIATSKAVGDVELPGHEECKTCHEDAVAGQCSTCHSDPTQAARIAPRRPQIHFSHASHTALPNVACIDCHSTVAAQVTVDQQATPGHLACERCHQQDFTSLDCQKCHETLANVPAARIADFRHPQGWDRMHRIQARADQDRCIQCHQPSFCTTCHDPTRMGGDGFAGALEPAVAEPERVSRSFIHRGDFRTTHPIEAVRAPAACLRCHDVRGCESCHRENGVITDRIGGAAGVHPTDWIAQHGAEARRNIVQCATCHERTGSGSAICVTCHSDNDRDPRNGSGISPHPRGFSRSFSERTTVCRQCHPSGSR